MPHSYNQHSSFAPLVSIVIILLVAGLISGFAFSRTELLNPWGAQANAANLNTKTDHEKKTYEQKERMDQANTDARIEQNNIQTNAMRNQVEANQQHQDRIHAIGENMLNALVPMVPYAFAGVIAVLLFYVFLPGVAWTLRIAKSSSYIPNPWQDAKYRRIKIAEAKRRERISREAEIQKELIALQNLFFNKKNRKG